MRIAVLPDIHGNLRALEAVLVDLKAELPDLVVNLGDHISGPLEAAETADLLMASGFFHIRENHDRQLPGPAVRRDGSKRSRRATPSGRPPARLARHAAAGKAD